MQLLVTGATGKVRSTAIRLARAFSALVLVARDRANLDETAEAVKAASAEALVIDIDLARLRPPGRCMGQSAKRKASLQISKPRLAGGRRMMRGGRVSVRRKVKVLSGVVIRQRPRIDQDRLIPNPRRRGIA